MNLLARVAPNSHGRASALPQAWPKVALSVAVSLVATVAEFGLHLRVPSVGTAPFTILGVAISIFLGFRNNNAYIRFWEARTLWGGLINASRAFTRQVLTLVRSESGDPEPFQKELVELTVAYGHALRNHLRSDDPMPEIEAALSPEAATRVRAHDNRPIAVLNLIGDKLASARARGWVSESATIVMEATLNEITNAQGGCERIKNTPIPETYALLSGSIVTFFCLFLTFGILDSAKILTPLVVALVAYALFGLDALGEEVTEPFGDDPHDLPLEKYTATIEKDLTQALANAR